jgi:hypothetical protein
MIQVEVLWIVTGAANSSETSVSYRNTEDLDLYVSDTSSLFIRGAESVIWGLVTVAIIT